MNPGIPLQGVDETAKLPIIHTIVLQRFCEKARVYTFDLQKAFPIITYLHRVGEGRAREEFQKNRGIAKISLFPHASRQLYNFVHYMLAQMKSINTVTICLLLLLAAGCGDLRDKAKEQAKQIAREEAQKAYEKAKAEADKKYEEAKSETNRRIDELKDENSELREKVEGYEGDGKKWLRYVKLALYVLGAITAIKLFGKPVARVSACIVLKHWSPSPRQVLPIQTKEED